MTQTMTPLLTDEMLSHFDERAPIYDRENRFFDEDWAELKSSGYLLCTVPTDLGGADSGWMPMSVSNVASRMWLLRPRWQ